MCALVFVLRDFELGRTCLAVKVDHQSCSGLIFTAVCGIICLPSGAGMPVEDQQLAVALLVELAVQRGSLSAMLAAVHLLLTVSSDVDVDRDNRLSTVLTHAPLVPVLRRFQALALASEASDDSDVGEVIFFKLLCFFHHAFYFFAAYLGRFNPFPL